MRKRQMLATAAAVLLAVTGPSLAAQPTPQKSQARAKSTVESQSRAAKSRSSADSLYDAPLRPYSPSGTSAYPWGPGYNFPYPDRPYGDPGRW